VTVWAAMSWYSVAPIITLHGQVIAREYIDRLGNDVRLMDHTIQRDSFPRRQYHIHTPGTIQSWFEEHAGELQDLSLSEQSPYLSIIVSQWSVLVSTVRDKCPPPRFL
jgi:hypothetical protein